MLHTLLWLSLVAGPTGANLLPDADFAKQSWELTTWAPCQATHRYEPQQPGPGTVIHLTGLDAKPDRVNLLAISPAVPVTAGQEYLFTVWYQTSAKIEAGLGLDCFKQPFATAAWKTPTTAYWNRPLTTSPGHYRLAAWRFTVPESTVELKVLLRLGQVGDVWFHHPSLTATGAARLTVDSLAAVDVGGQRVFRGAVQAPPTLAWRLELRRPDALSATIQGQGPGRADSAPFDSATGQTLQPVLCAADGAVLDVADGVVAPLAALTVTKPAYRQSIYASARPDQVVAELALNATPALLRRLTWRAALRPAAAPAPGGEFAPADKPVVGLKLRPPTEPGEYRLSADVKTPQGEEHLGTTIRVVPPAAGHEVVIDARQRLLVDGRPFYPRGYFGVPDAPEQIAPVVAAHNNTALTYSPDPDWHLKWLDRLQAAGLMGICHVPWNGKAIDLAKIRAGIDKVKGHPALLAWYLVDEPGPEKPGQTPAEIETIYQAVAAADPYHPIAVCIDVPDYERRYAAGYDILLIDPYPLVRARQPVSMIAEHMDHATAAIEQRKPVWLVPQTFGWDVIQGLTGPPSYLTPTPEQAAAIYLLGLTHRAGGLVGYCYHVYTQFDAAKQQAGGWPWVLGGYLPDKQPRLWAGLAQVTGWLHTIEPWLAADDVRPGRAGLVDFIWYVKDRRACLVAVNRSETQAATEHLAAPWAGPLGLEPVTGAPKVADNGRVQLTLPPLGVAVVEVRQMAGVDG